MGILAPHYLQNGVYSARLDRHFVKYAMGDGERVLGDGFVVAPNGTAGSVTITEGAVVIAGDDSPDQGHYLCVSDSTVTLPMPAAPGSGKRIDLIVAKVLDPQAGGSAGDTWQFAVVQGTVVAASGTPTTPALPSSATAVASSLRVAGTSNAGTVTNLGARGARSLFGIISESAPVGDAADGTIWVTV